MSRRICLLGLAKWRNRSMPGRCSPHEAGRCNDEEGEDGITPLWCSSNHPKLAGVPIAVLAQFIVLWASLPVGVGQAQALNFKWGQWETECNIKKSSNEDCSVIGLFGNTLPNGKKGSFSLLLDLNDQRVVVVGQPTPISATIQIDRNLPLRCIASPHCIFSAADTDAITQQLDRGSLILVGVVTAAGTFKTSLDTQGYRAGIAKMRANGRR